MSFTLAFIPARGGSKGITNKNLALINGIPLIYYTLNICKKINVNDTFVSSDNEEILAYCSSQGFQSKYKRPDNLSTDTSPTIEAVFHGIDWYQRANNIQVDNVILLQPTFPLRKYKEVNKALRFYNLNKLKSLVSVSPMREHPFECIDVDKNMEWEFIKNPQKKSQEDRIIQANLVLLMVLFIFQIINI